ncbi:putative proline-rich receptor-like protein kinase PERK11 isoform X3 [Hevea brasiliensis]|uniref:putative proline-rich receptor-like protein kinase PERK11 isoform X3 n=1 Tax=Hevea brasiliensis TaxID=3981 RepID=UPI0025D1DB2A|nr:putative proline-rich receptor-like protein kinase PERK11 isoform X3 [Hevea brasiliensis]
MNRADRHNETRDPNESSSSHQENRSYPSASENYKGIGPRPYSYRELANATDHFSNNVLLGEGGFGQVYMGFLDGKYCAIKKLKNLRDVLSEENLENEILVVSRVSHKNLVQLIGYCIDGANRLIVLEYCPNESLRSKLHEEGEILDWQKRMKIAIGSARGLEYLHEYCKPRIIHLDIKPDNILLDNEFEPKIADFGLALFFSDAATHVSKSTNKGTQVYADPMTTRTGKYSDKSDIYSFGVVLLELITGKEPMDKDNDIVNWANSRIKKALKGEYEGFVDSRLQTFDHEEMYQEMYRMIFCAKACVNRLPKSRPSMRRILLALEGNLPLENLCDEKDNKLRSSTIYKVKKEERAIPRQATGDGTEEETKNVIMPRQLPNQQWTTATNYDFSNNNIGSSLVHIPQMVYADVALVSGAGISHNRKFCYGYATSPGKGSSMEDFYETRIDSVDGEIVGLFGVFDGHGGARAAEYVKQNLFSNLIRHPKFISDTKSAIADAYNHTDSEFLKSENNQNSESGSTASTAILIGDRLLVANVGDSRAVTCRGGNAIAASRDHKPDRSDERQRIEDAGGFVTWAGTWKVGGVLAVSRAFGDRLLKQYVVADPEIQDEKIDSSLEFLILASYGLWDVVTNEEAVVMTKPIEDPELAAKSLLQEAYQRGSAYNITCIVVRFLANQGTPTTHDSRMI